jgi:hypothetical protein
VAVKHDVMEDDRIRSRVRGSYPALHFVRVDDGWLLRGSISIEHRGRELDWFKVEIDLRPLQVGVLPVVREIGGRIPWEKDRHVNLDGTACVCLPEAYFYEHPGPIDLLTFLDQVRGYFIGQALVMQGGPWPHGEWDHGDEGLDEWFHGDLGARPRRERRAWLRALTARTLNEERGFCPCGSGKRLRYCHLNLVQRLRQSKRICAAIARPDALRSRPQQRARRLQSP